MDMQTKTNRLDSNRHLFTRNKAKTNQKHIGCSTTTYSEVQTVHNAQGAIDSTQQTGGMNQDTGNTHQETVRTTD